MVKRFENIEDFVFDTSFQSWVLRNDHQAAVFWHRFRDAHPEKQALMAEARAIVLALQTPQHPLPAEEISGAIGDIWEAIRQQPAVAEKAPVSQLKHWIPVKKWMAVAASLLLLTAAAWLWQSRRFSTSTASAAVTEQINTTTADMPLQLPDGSHVVLKPGSRLTYTTASFSKARQVTLSGEAFFDIRKLPGHPFQVITGSLVTQVLGTSFIVHAYPGDAHAYVSVQTGKVSVRKKEETAHAAAKDTEQAGCVLIPNQKAVFDENTRALTKTITDNPVIIRERPQAGGFVFDATPMKKVFSRLEEAYGIPIVYDEETMAGCSLTGSFGNESFFDKLSLICQSVNARYEILDGSVVITAKGCR